MEHVMRVDIAIMTIREDEFIAVRRRFQTERRRVPGGRTYLIGEVKTEKRTYTIAIARCSEQGTDASQRLAHYIIHNLDPRLILVVGIAGGTPRDEFTLGDVVVSSRIVNANVDAWHPDDTTDYTTRGGPPHPLVENIVSLLPGEPQMAGWTDTIQLERPTLDPGQVNITGDEEWREKVRQSLSRHFGEELNRGRPLTFTIGPILSSNHLMKDSARLREILKTHRSILAVEMEVAGVYEAAQGIDHQYPVMAIRGISDIVGLQRDSRWTEYACQAAAAFTYAFIMTDPLDLPLNSANIQRPVVPSGISSDQLRGSELPLNTQHSVWHQQIQQPLPEETPDTEPLKTITVPGQQPPRKNRRVPKVGQVGNVEFERFEPSNLRSVPVVVQALDNQWLPRSLLQPALKAGQITKGLDRKLRRAVRSEYIRSLINGQQVILNRAYLYNNPAISQDYSQTKGQKREAFKALVEEEVIVPYLLAEKTPVDPPASGAGTVSGYEVDKAFSAWQELCQEVRPRCVRLSWDDQENWHLTRRQLAERFNTFATSAAARDIDSFVQDLRLDSSARNQLRKRLVEMGQLCLDFINRDRLATRNDLYKAFVTAGDSPAERRYDSTKPFAVEMKQLLDLAYNSNLPDALGGYLITPIDSLPRTALQEWQQAARQPTITGEELLKMLQRTAFDLVGRGLNVESMAVLSLQDVREIRSMDEWRTYIQSLEALLNKPFQFADGGAARVYESYARLAKRITGLIAGQQRKDEVLNFWAPAVELVFYIAGAVLSVMWTQEGIIYQLSGQVSGLVGPAAVPIVGRLVIRDMAEKKAQQDLSTSTDFMRSKMVDARKQWKEIEHQVRKLSGFRELALSLGEEEIVDPTLSYQEIEY